MNLSEFIEGLTILQKYYDKPDGYHIGAEHDQFWAYATQKPLSAEDYDRMIELGWMQDESPDDKAPYDPEASWTCYT